MIQYVNSGHSNTSALESRFSIAKRAQLNDTAKYQHAAANANSIATYKHKREGDKRRSKKMKKGNTSYPGELIASERPESAQSDFMVGQVLKRRKDKVDRLLSCALLTDWETPPLTKHILPASVRVRPLTRVCKDLLPKLQKQRIEEGSFCQMLRKDPTIRDLMVLTVESTSHWESMEMLLSETGSHTMEKECTYLVGVAFELLDKAVAAPKLSHESSFWWQVMRRMRDESVHSNSPTPGISKHIRSYLFQLFSGKLFSWARKQLGGQEVELLAKCKLQQDVPGEIIDFATIGTDVNTFVGFSLFSLKKKYGDFEELGNGSDDEDKYWLLTDVVATEDEISCNEDYCSKYYDSYYVVLNRGDMTLVSPRYAELFHKILFQISKMLNVIKMVENRNKFMEQARDEVARNLPAWSKDLERRAEGVYMVNPEKTCEELLSEIVTKIFNSKGNAVLKRYYSMFLARGGKEQSSRSTLRESRKQEGLGSRKKKMKKT